MFEQLAAAIFVLGMSAQAEAVRETEAETASTSNAEQVNDDAAEKELICKRTQITGSKFKKKICGTRDQWAEMTARSRDNAREMQTRGKGLDPNGG